jgi:aspartyl protease family protein
MAQLLSFPDRAQDELDLVPELPRPDQRWTVQRKTTVVRAVRYGWVPIEELCELYNIRSMSSSHGSAILTVRCAGAAYDPGSDLPHDDKGMSDLTPDDKAIIAAQLKAIIASHRFRLSPHSVRRLKAIPVGALFIVMLMAAPAPLPAQAPAKCKLNQAITDVHGNHGVIFGGHDDLCLIKYKDGQTQRWVALKNLNMIAPTATPAAPWSAAPISEAVADRIKLLRPTDFNRLVYRADARGHVVLTAAVDGVPIKFLVDTGATLVSLSLKDAAAAGLRRDELVFNRTVQTGNGPVKAALAQIREMRIERLQMKDIQVVVLENLQQSVLGMSFLHRLKAFEMRDGELSMTW